MSPSSRAAATPVEVHDLGTVDYVAAWDQQRAHADARAAGTGPDVLMLLEHPSVYTAGRRTLDDERPTDGTPVVDVDRGGKITWHGPGQLVGYPIIGLAEPVDVVAHVRRLEEALLAVCDAYGLAAGRVEGRSGVWLPADGGRSGASAATGGRPARKIGAIGVRVARGVTLHGFALNADPDLAAFSSIVPCGIRDAGVTSLTAELGRHVGVAEIRERTRDAVLDALDGRLPVTGRALPAADAGDRVSDDLVTWVSPAR